ncbi:MAG: hypothetical protein A2Y88_15255 [Chloroflexi bacterium RBG_13_48_10]|nr:MAG: hypothetical protein A2Y88_15255 [Chloroflexi bacterium RBG_13_48_10]
MKDVIFAFMLGAGEEEKDALRLAQSIRTFAGELCFNPIWLLSQRSEDELSEDTRQELFSLGARLISFDLDPGAMEFPFVGYVTAAGIAEGLAQGVASFLVMMASDTLVLRTPSACILPGGKSLGACPVHLKLLGSGTNDPIDDFWRLIYHHCQVEIEKIFSMQTIVDEQLVRAYFNAGLLVVRPERGLLRAWQADFNNTYRLPEFEAIFQQNEYYAIFMHQAVLAGSVLSSLKPGEFQQLPFEMNYPLHLHTRVAVGRRPSNLNQLITCRYEDYGESFGNPEVNASIQIDKPLKEWLQTHFE